MLSHLEAKASVRDQLYKVSLKLIDPAFNNFDLAAEYQSHLGRLLDEADSLSIRVGTIRWVSRKRAIWRD